MAEKRCISKSISISEKVNSLPDVFDMLLFTWMITHTDDFGRLTGAPAKVKALVVPMLDKTVREVEQSLRKLHEENLIIWYEVNGEKVIQIVNFEKHQTGLHKRTKSKFPENPLNKTELPGTSGNFREIPSEGKGREENGIEENGREGNCDRPLTNPHEQKILNLMSECKVQNIDLYPVDQICSYIGMVDIEVIEFCIRKGAGKHINYTLRTLEGLVKEGKTTKDSVTYIQAVPDHQQKKKTDPELEARRKEIAFNKWMQEGKNPDDFIYPSTGT